MNQELINVDKEESHLLMQSGKLLMKGFSW